MIIQAELKCKQTGCEADPCAVDKVIELPSPRFRQFSRALLADYDFIAENKDAIQRDEDARHCLLILDAEGTDGFLIDPQGYDYARYSAFVPNARSLLTPDMGIDRIEKRLNGQTLQEHMEDVLDELCNQLPEREYARISKAIQAESTAAREREEAAQTWSAYRVLENGEEWCFKVAPGEELLNAAERLNRYLKEPPDTGSKFIRLFSCGTLLTSEEYQQMIAERMENTGKVRGVFELDFDKREFSAVHIMDGWRTWAMRDVSAAVYHATRSQFASSDDKWRKLLDHLSGKEITSAGHLSARNFSFGDEIIESDGKLNFYVQTEFDVDAAFGTFVLTDKNDDWLNVYANYDIAEDRPCDTLELTLCKGDGSEESWSYPLNAAEQDVLLRKMEEYCQQQTGMSLHDYAQQFREEPEQRQGPVMKL